MRPGNSRPTLGRLPREPARQVGQRLERSRKTGIGLRPPWPKGERMAERCDCLFVPASEQCHYAELVDRIGILRFSEQRLTRCTLRALVLARCVQCGGAHDAVAHQSSVKRQSGCERSIGRAYTPPIAPRLEQKVSLRHRQHSAGAQVSSSPSARTS